MFEVFNKCTENLCLFEGRTYQLVRNAKKQVIRYQLLESDSDSD